MDRRAASSYRVEVNALDALITIRYTPPIPATRWDPPEPAEWEFDHAQIGNVRITTIEALAADLSTDEPVTVTDIETAIDEALREGA